MIRMKDFAFPFQRLVLLARSLVLSFLRLKEIKETTGRGTMVPGGFKICKNGV